MPTLSVLRSTSATLARTAAGVVYDAIDGTGAAGMPGASTGDIMVWHVASVVAS